MSSPPRSPSPSAPAPHPDSHSSSDLDSPSPPRANRWRGAPSTWASLTSQERGLAASLTTLRDTDLSIHLYNAYVLKKRAINPTLYEEEFVHLPEQDRNFKPPRHWTAWPLRPEDVPREEDGDGNEDERETFRRVEEGGKSMVLEDVLIGTTLRVAKERFLGRESAGADEGLGDEAEILEKDEEGGGQGSGIVGEIADAEAEAQAQGDSGAQGESIEPAIKEASEPPPPGMLLKPVVSADDDRSRELLRPSIRHALSKLDEVLMALHHTRKTCRQNSHSSTTTTDDETPAVESSAPAKRPKGRPRKFANLTDRSRSQAKAIDDAELFRAKKTHVGRPQKVYERLEGESQQEYLIRIARIQKKPLPAFAPPRELAEVSEAGASGKSPARKATEEEKERDRQRRTRPRDWSEVLGAAALVGFPPEVIARATQRCANLFGESMIMRTMIETSFSERGGDVLTRYRPQLIPDLGNEGAIESSESDDSEASASEPGSGRRTRARPNRPLGQAPMRQTCFCSISDCPRKTRGFNGNGKLRRHLRRAHNIPMEELDEYILPSDEEMDGAVHVDGFLKPLKWRQGPRGRYKKDGKRSRTGSDEDDSEENEEEPTSRVESRISEPAGADGAGGEESSDE